MYDQLSTSPTQRQATWESLHKKLTIVPPSFFQTKKSILQMEIINQFQVYTYTYMNTWITADRMGRPIEIGKSNIVQRSCVNDAIRLWNLAPPNITESSSLYQAKKEIKKYARTLPVWEEKLNKLTNNNKERSLKWQKIKVKMQKTNNF